MTIDNHRNASAPPPFCDRGRGRRGRGRRIPSRLAPLLCACLLACSDEADVTLYVSADEHIARQVIDAFKKETGLTVDFVGDTEARKTTGLVERLRSERDSPQADVFWSSEIFLTIALAEEGVLAPFESEATSDWPKQFRNDENRWYGFAARARVIVYSPQRVTHENVPGTWTDLAQRRSLYRDRVVMADPRFGTTGGHLAAMKAYWDRHAMPGYYEAFLLGLRDNGVRLLPSGNAGVVRAIVDGEADFGMTDTDDVWAAKERGLSIALVYPDHLAEDTRGNGTLLIPNTVALVNGAPNPVAAGQLIDFLLSPSVERILAESVSHNIPLRPALAEEYDEYTVPDPLDVNYARAAAARDKAVAMAMRILTENPSSSSPLRGGEPSAAAGDGRPHCHVHRKHASQRPASCAQGKLDARRPGDGPARRGEAARGDMRRIRLTAAKPRRDNL